MPKDDNRDLKLNPLFYGSKYGDQLRLDLSSLDLQDIDTRDPKHAQRIKRFMEMTHQFVDASDAYASNGFWVGFEHIPSGRSVHFKAFITTLNENFNSDWASETLFGRPDGVHMYKSTNRTMTVSLMMPAASESEGFENLGKVQQLVQFLYPAYENVQNAQTIAQSPLIRLKIMNLYADRSFSQISEDTQSSQGTFGDMKAQEGGTSWDTGLLGVLKGLNVNQNIGNPDIGVFEMSRGTIIPKLIEINFDFDVLHEHALGWSQEGKFSQRYFPYGVNTKDSAPRTEKDRQAEAKAAIGAWNKAYREQREKERGEEPPQQARDNALSALGDALKKGLTNRKDRKAVEAAGITSNLSSDAGIPMGGAANLPGASDIFPTAPEPYGPPGGEYFDKNIYNDYTNPWE